MRKKAVIAMMLPSVIGFGVFYFVPLLMTFFYAVVRNPFDLSFVGLENIRTTIQNEYFRMAVTQTFRFVGKSILLTLPAALVYVYLAMQRPGFPVSHLILPNVLPTVSVALIWNVLFGRDSFLSAIGVSSTSALQALFLWKNVGIHIILLLSALSQMPKNILEAADIDGAGETRKFIYIVIPHLLPTMFFCMIYIIMCAFRIFKDSYILYGAYPDEKLFMVQHYIFNQFNKLRYANVASAGLIFAVPVILLVMLLYIPQVRGEEWK